tara:strand:+ start:18018 stop:18863 length:846 start_codon:yes stop_codon:yes gene_type:complete
MDTLTVKVGTPLQIHLNSAIFTTGLTASSFTVTGSINSTAVSNAVSELSFGVTGISATHYLATVTYQKEGTHYLKIAYTNSSSGGEFTETYLVEYLVHVVKDTVGFLSGRESGADGEYVFTVTDSSDNAVEGATVRVMDSAGTKILMRLTTNSSGKVTFSIAAGTYKLYTTKSGYDFSSVNPSTITVVASNYLAPVVSEFLPTSPSADGVLAVSGMHFNSGTTALVDGTAVTPTSISSAGGLLLLTMPSTASGTSTVQLRNVDPDDSAAYLLSTSYTVSIT